MRRARPSTRARGCSASATRAARRSTGSRRTATPTPSRFPVARVPGLDFSFSGLKTALLYTVRDLGAEELERRRADLAASYQRAIVRALVERTREAAEPTGAERIAVVGGVAANSELRAALPDAAQAPLELCTDNAAMIASAARFVEPIAYPRYLALEARAPRRRAGTASVRTRGSVPGDLPLVALAAAAISVAAATGGSSEGARAEPVSWRGSSAALARRSRSGSE